MELRFVALEVKGATAQRGHCIGQTRDLLETGRVDVFRGRGPAQLGMQRLAVRFLPARILPHAHVGRRLRLVVFVDRRAQSLSGGSELIRYQRGDTIAQARLRVRKTIGVGQ